MIAERLYAPEEIAGPVAVVLDGAVIHAIWRGTDAANAQRRLAREFPGMTADITDLGTLRLAPGYVDMHTHGFRGHDITTGSAEDIAAMAAELPGTGVTAFFPTIATTGRAETIQQVRRIVEVIEHQSERCGAQVLGIRLEGPFISRAKKGAQYEPGIRPPDPAEMETLAQAGQGWVRIVDYAPEEDTDQQFLRTLKRLGILPCIGHTAATYEQAIAAIDGGARHSTHLFNAMSPFDHRAPGVPGALLTDPRVTVEVIADGIHLSPAALRLAVAARGIEHVALITDAVVAAGMPDGEYQFINRTVRVAEGAVRLTNGTLAGSALTIERGVQQLVALAGLGWPDAIHMATLTPARITGMADRKGAIRPGVDADLVALDENGAVQRTWVRGHTTFER